MDQYIMLQGSISCPAHPPRSCGATQDMFPLELFVIDNEHHTRYTLAALELQMIWSRNDSGMTPCRDRERQGSTGCPVSVLLVIVTCVCRRWFSEGQVKRRLIALSNPSFPWLQSWQHTTHVITHRSVVRSAVFKVLHSCSWMFYHKCFHPWA